MVRFKMVFDKLIQTNLLSSATWTLLGTVISKALNLLAFIIVARVVGKIAYGELGILQNTLISLASFSSLGLSTTATKYIASLREGDSAKIGRILGLTFSITIISGLIFALIVSFNAESIAKNILNAPHLEICLRIGSIFVFFYVLTGLLNGILAGFEEYKIITKIGILANLISVPCIIIGAWLWGINGGLLGLELLFIINSALGYLAVKRKVQNEAIEFIYKNSWKESGVIWRFSVPAFLSNTMVVLIVWYSNILLVNQDDGYSSMGVFNVALQWQAVILFLPVSLAPVLLSTLSKANTHYNKNDFWKLVKLSIFLNAIIVGLVSLAIYFMSGKILLLYGPDFVNETMIFKMMIASSFLSALSNIVGQVIASSASMWWGVFLNLLWAIVFVGSLYLNLERKGAEGLVLSYLIANLCHIIWVSTYVYFISSVSQKIRSSSENR